MPAVKNHNAVNAPGCLGPKRVRRFAPTRLVFEEADQVLAGVTRDSGGAPLGTCTVYAFRSDFLASVQVIQDSSWRLASGADRVANLPRTAVTHVARTTSDGSGNFSIGPLSRNSGPYFLVAWDAAGTVAGITLNTLQPPA